MDALTLIALKESIAHWKRMAEGEEKTGEGPLHKDCPLCELFFPLATLKDQNTDESKDCVGCPIFENTRTKYCQDTPYSDAYDAWDYSGPGSDAFRDYAWNMLEFLESLLPKEEK